MKNRIPAQIFIANNNVFINEIDMLNYVYFNNEDNTI